MNKPIAITGLSLLLVSAGVICLLIAIGALQLLGEGQGSGLLISSFAIIGAACCLLAYGLFTLQSWAWPVGIAMVIASVALALLSVISRSTLAGLVVSLVPALVLLSGLFLPSVRNALGRDGSQEAKAGTASSNSQKQNQQKTRNTGRRG
jgi:uncharacterized membrane protein YdfJ with MMPL/SSD domain